MICFLAKVLCRELDVLDAGISYNVIEQSGSWFSFEGTKFAQGREQAFAYLETNPDICETMRNQIERLWQLSLAGKCTYEKLVKKSIILVVVN